MDIFDKLGRNFLFPGVDNPNVVSYFPSENIWLGVSAGFVVEGGSSEGLRLFGLDKFNSFFEGGAGIRDVVDNKDVFVFDWVDIKRRDKFDFLG